MQAKKRSPTDRTAGGSDARVAVARFAGPHGVAGELRLKSYTAVPSAVVDYGPFDSSDGRRFELAATRPAGGKADDILIVRAEGITDRTAAEALVGLELTVPRDRLPETEPGDYYQVDLIGLTAKTVNGDEIGTVTAIFNHGAGDILEIALPRLPSVLVPFTSELVPSVEIEAGVILVDPPAGFDEIEGDTS